MTPPPFTAASPPSRPAGLLPVKSLLPVVAHVHMLPLCDQQWDNAVRWVDTVGRRYLYTEKLVHKHWVPLYNHKGQVWFLVTVIVAASAFWRQLAQQFHSVSYLLLASKLPPDVPFAHYHMFNTGNWKTYIFHLTVKLMIPLLLMRVGNSVEFPKVKGCCPPLRFSSV